MLRKDRILSYPQSCRYKSEPYVNLCYNKKNGENTPGFLFIYISILVQSTPKSISLSSRAFSSFTSPGSLMVF